MRSAVLFLVFAGCGSETLLSERASCDGILQSVENGVVDGPFDVDKDGFFDGGNPDCAAFYDASRLDCNDADADVSPNGTEVTCNLKDDDCNAETVDDPDGDGDSVSVCDDCDDDNKDIAPTFEELCDDEIDNNCNGEVDEDCTTVSGIYDVAPAPSYICGGGVVSVGFSGVAVEYSPPLLRVTGLGGGSQPGQMDGNITSDGQFSVTHTIQGTCNETYTMNGTFDATEGTFSGTFEVDFSGFLCLGCRRQSFEVSGVRR